MLCVFFWKKWVNWILTPPPYFTARFLSSSFYVFQWIRQQCSNRRKDVHHTNAVNYTDHLHDGRQPGQHCPSWRRSLRRKQWKSIQVWTPFNFFQWEGGKDIRMIFCQFVSVVWVVTTLIKVWTFCIWRHCRPYIIALAPQTSHLVKLSLPDIFHYYFSILLTAMGCLLMTTVLANPKRGRPQGHASFSIIFFYVHAVFGKLAEIIGWGPHLWD